MQRGGVDLDERAGGRAERLDLRGVELAVDNLLTLGEQQNKVASTQVELARAVILQAVELRVVAVAPAQLERTAAIHEQAERIGALDLLQLRRGGHVLAALGDGRCGERLDERGGQAGRDVIPHAAIGFEFGVGNRVDMHVRSCSFM